MKKMNEIYNQKLIYSTIDSGKINYNFFRKNRVKIFEKICEDINKGNFKFDNYKVILIPKDVNVQPRKICIASMKDRIILEILKEILYDVYEGCNLGSKVGIVVDDFIDIYNSNKYNKYIYMDLEKFYDNISHIKLINKISKKTEEKWFIDLLKKAIKNDQKYKSIFKNKVGVPQGLSISNLLANIYMIDFDSEMGKEKEIKYLRYVDDIFIFHNSNIERKLINKIEQKIKKNSLKININKTKHGNFKAKKEIFFLGYRITKNCITVKDETVKKLECRIEQIFKSYHYSAEKNLSSLEWVLNLRITGAILENKKYGWLYYFSKINDIKLLRHLDYLIETFKIRYNVKDIKTKSFIKAHREIIYNNPAKSKYLLNLDSLSIEQKKKIIIDITKYTIEEIEKYDTKVIDVIFKRYMYKTVNELERDLDSLS